MCFFLWLRIVKTPVKMLATDAKKDLTQSQFFSLFLLAHPFHKILLFSLSEKNKQNKIK